MLCSPGVRKVHVEVRETAHKIVVWMPRVERLQVLVITDGVDVHLVIEQSEVIVDVVIVLDAVAQVLVVVSVEVKLVLVLTQPQLVFLILVMLASFTVDFTLFLIVLVVAFALVLDILSSADYGHLIDRFIGSFLVRLHLHRKHERSSEIAANGIEKRTS